MLHLEKKKFRAITKQLALSTARSFFWKSALPLGHLATQIVTDGIALMKVARKLVSFTSMEQSGLTPPRANVRCHSLGSL
jgi:hypothetical protein